MTLGELFAEGGITLLGVVLFVLAIGVVIGCSLGYFTASRDLDAERAKAWDRGSNDTLHAVARKASPGTALGIFVELRNPFRRPKLKAAPGYTYTSPRIPLPVPESPLFDQDEHPRELRGDD